MQTNYILTSRLLLSFLFCTLCGISLAQTDDFISEVNPVEIIKNVALEKYEQKIKTERVVSSFKYVRLGNLKLAQKEKVLEPAEYTAEWGNQATPPGIYLFRLQTESGTETKRITLTR